MWRPTKNAFSFLRKVFFLVEDAFVDAKAFFPTARADFRLVFLRRLAFVLSPWFLQTPRVA